MTYGYVLIRLKLRAAEQHQLYRGSKNYINGLAIRYYRPKQRVEFAIASDEETQKMTGRLTVKPVDNFLHIV